MNILPDEELLYCVCFKFICTHASLVPVPEAVVVVSRMTKPH